MGVVGPPLAGAAIRRLCMLLELAGDRMVALPTLRSLRPCFAMAARAEPP